MGIALVVAAGSWKAAVIAYRRAWTLLKGNHLEGVRDADMDGRVDEGLLEFVRSMVAHGIQARARTTASRWRCKPRQSVMEHLAEAYANMWNDAQARQSSSL